MTKVTLLAALVALGPGAFYGLFLFNHETGLDDVPGPVPIAMNVFLPSNSDGSFSIELEDIIPLFLAHN